MKIENRKGASKISLIPPEIKDLLDKGEIATTNLIEWLAIDQSKLLKTVLNSSKKEKYLKNGLEEIDKAKQKTAGKITEIIARYLLDCSKKNNDNEIFSIISKHKSDAVRCWGAYFIGLDDDLKLSQKFIKIEEFATDDHFGVREIAWMAIRKDIAENLEESIKILTKLAKNKNPNLRRFASEATRPRGVWCCHINQLKKDPQIALEILELLRSDKEKYVQNSVANWLNDAGKTRPDWVLELSKKWQNISKTQETDYIIKRALRNLAKSV